MFSLSSIPESVRRGTPQAALASCPLPLEPAVTLHLLTDGSLTVRHGDRTAELVPGSMLFTSTSEPLVMSRQDRCDMTTITVPVARLRLPARVLRRTQARVFTPADPVVASGVLLLQRLAQDAQAHPESDWSVLEQSMIELMRALLLLNADDERSTEPSPALGLGERIGAYLEQHFLEAGLDASRIASAHNISVRYLYVILRSRNIVLGEWMRDRRLAHAAELLRDPRSAGHSIAEIAHRSGFADHAHFSRSFRNRYATTPREWRSGRAA